MKIIAILAVLTLLSVGLVSAVTYTNEEYNTFYQNCLPNLFAQQYYASLLGYNYTLAFTEENIFSQCIDSSWNVPILRQRWLNHLAYLRYLESQRHKGGGSSLTQSIDESVENEEVTYDRFDFNQDGVVNTGDIAGFRASKETETNEFKQCLSESCDNSDFDSNHDGVTNGLDIPSFKENQANEESEFKDELTN